MENQKQVVYEPIKRKRGRPKKNQTAVPAQPKRKRGRPKKQVDFIALNQPAPPKRKRGRPKKEEKPILKTNKKRGRPRKEKEYYDISTNQIVSLKEEKSSLSKIHNSRENQQLVEYITKRVQSKLVSIILKSLVDN